MLFNGIFRFSTQLKCYFFLILWIFLLIGGMYKYVGNLTISNNLIREHEYPSTTGNDNAQKFQKFKEVCTPLDDFSKKHQDGGNLIGWKLQGVLLVIRHGDRGPLSHIHGVSSIDCGVDANNNLLKRYKNFLSNFTNPSGINHMFWNKLGSFHGFPLLPPTLKSCLLGQLTYKGITQHLHLGELLYHTYAHSLGLFNKYGESRIISDPTMRLSLITDEIVVYTTRMRRTFQSAMALLFPFIPVDKWSGLNLQESHSLAFCFSDCACPHADFLQKKIQKASNKKLKLHPSISAIAQWIGTTVLQNPLNGFSSIQEVVDAMLIILCHEAPLPCRALSKNMTLNEYSSTSIPGKELDSNDVINIDQDENTSSKATETPQEAYSVDPFQEGCVEESHLNALMYYFSKESAKDVLDLNYKRLGLLRSYGMIRHIVGYMLRMISGEKTKFVLYSGHDHTLQYLAAALGIKRKNTFIPYASRLGIEVYKSETSTDYYFRLLWNGVDVTRSIDFCEGEKSLRVNRDNRGNKADLCPIENIIRFIHEDYFSPLNATNFKDACLSSTKV